MDRRKVMLVVEYDGTDFAGFQVQARGYRTVQGVLEEALARVTGERVRVVGAARTDAGVHALGQVVSAETGARLPVEAFVPALNSRLPGDVRVREAREVPPDFDARRQARRKLYRYTVLNTPVASVFWRRFAYHVPRPLDHGAMVEAARRLVGRHDFRAFQNAGSPRGRTERTLFRLEPARHPDGRVTFDCEADGFLYNMARILVGTLLEVGQGRRTVESVAVPLRTGRRADAGPTAPPHGLCLVRVEYDD